MYSIQLQRANFVRVFYSGANPQSETCPSGNQYEQIRWSDWILTGVFRIAMRIRRLKNRSGLKMLTNTIYHENIIRIFHSIMVISNCRTWNGHHVHFVRVFSILKSLTPQWDTCCCTLRLFFRTKDQSLDWGSTIIFPIQREMCPTVL
jgi:hypothetical protein